MPEFKSEPPKYGLHFPITNSELYPKQEKKREIPLVSPFLRWTRERWNTLDKKPLAAAGIGGAMGAALGLHSHDQTLLILFAVGGAVFAGTFYHFADHFMKKVIS